MSGCLFHSGDGVQIRQKAQGTMSLCPGRGTGQKCASVPARMSQINEDKRRLKDD